MGFKSHLYEDGFLAYLICSVPADHYNSGRKISLTLLVPSGAADDVLVQPGATAPKATRHNERPSSSSVEGTAFTSLERSS